MARENKHQSDSFALKNQAQPENQEKPGEPDLVPLSLARPCDRLEVVHTVGGRAFRARMAALGISPGTELKVTCNLGGPVMVEAKGSRLSLGRGMAEKILVKRKRDGEPCPCPELPECPEKHQCERK